MSLSIGSTWMCKSEDAAGVMKNEVLMIDYIHRETDEVEFNNGMKMDMSEIYDCFQQVRGY